MKAAIISQGSESSKWTYEAMKKYFEEVDEINVKNLELSISGSTAQILHKGEPLKKYDCIYAKGSFRYSQILRSLTSILHKECYMPIIPSAFTIAHDKLLTQLMMQQHSIPMPKTYISSTIDSARQLLSSLNYPIIMKFPQGTQGKGVMFADSYSSASSILDALSALKQSFIIQEYIDTGSTDLRAFVVGEKVVASMIRKGAKDEVRSNIHTGGTGEVIEIDEHTKQIAIKAAKAIGAEICGVDILQGYKGPLVIEANISPGLQGITKATKVDIADKIAKYLYEQTKHRKDNYNNKIKKEAMADINNESTIITNLDFRGSRILLPEMTSVISKIKSEDQIEITAKKDYVSLKKII
ncbi:RimK family alpha-L-glutamate ligase [Candidatus Woesearchaeota archaeon]|nr:RimK family alpha-L-glutamate ligase [Candidatus Woesearchaeota archaeon]